VLKKSRRPEKRTSAAEAGGWEITYGTAEAVPLREASFEQPVKP
jgi:hypothetical protein